MTRDSVPGRHQQVPPGSVSGSPASMHARSNLHRRRLAIVALAGFVGTLFVPTSVANAEVTRRVVGPRDDATGLVIVSPFRVEMDVEPGVNERIEFTLTNDSDAPVDVTLEATDIAAASDPRNFVEKVEDGEFGAGDWLEPEIRDLRMEPWEVVTFELAISPPTDAPVGTNLAGMTVNTAGASGAPGTDDQGSGLYRSEALVQVFLTVPGPVEHDLRVLDVDVRDTYVFGSRRFVVWDVTFRNEGTVNEHVTGTVDVRSIFGNTAHRQRLQESLVLRGSTRTHRIVWHDLPWVGTFTPHVRVRGDDAKLVRATGERVVIFPWWLPVAIAMSILLPLLFLWWRRRREWQLYMEDEDLAEPDYWDDQETRI